MSTRGVTRCRSRSHSGVDRTGSTKECRRRLTSTPCAPKLLQVWRTEGQVSSSPASEFPPSLPCDARPEPTNAPPEPAVVPQDRSPCASRRQRRPSCPSPRQRRPHAASTAPTAATAAALHPHHASSPLCSMPHVPQPKQLFPVVGLFRGHGCWGRRVGPRVRGLISRLRKKGRFHVSGKRVVVFRAAVGVLESEG